MDKYNSSSVENFIKTIYIFGSRDGWDTKSGAIARELGITNAAATDMARKLAVKNLIDYEKYKDLKLTNAGEKLAMSVIRKHRLWETFLFQVLGLSLHEIHREAEMLEHATSDFLMDKICQYLGNPELDPHGDPIPNKEGKLDNYSKYISISEARENEIYNVCRLSSSEEEFFDFCNAHKISPGATIKIRKHYVKNEMTEIAVGDTVLLLNSSLASFIFVEKINTET